MAMLFLPYQDPGRAQTLPLLPFAGGGQVHVSSQFAPAEHCGVALLETSSSPCELRMELAPDHGSPSSHNTGALVSCV